MQRWTGVSSWLAFVSTVTGNCVTVRFHATIHGNLDMSLMIHVIGRCYQKAFMRDKYSSLHWDREQCEKGRIEAINKTGLEYFTVYFVSQECTRTVRYNGVAARSRMINQHGVSCLLNARGNVS